jgi:signal transduction histidine kinase
VEFVTVTPPLEDQYREAFSMSVAGDGDEHALLAAYDCGRQAQPASVLDPADPERLTHALNNVDHQTERLGRLVTLLMDATTLDLGQLDIHREWTDVNALVEQVAKAAQMRTNDSRKRLGRPARFVGGVASPLVFEMIQPQ